MNKQLVFTMASLFVFLFTFMTKETSAQTLGGEDQIFTSANDKLNSLTALQEKNIGNIAKRPTTADINIVQGIRFNKLIDMEYISMDIFSHTKLKFIRQKIQKNNNYGHVWYGVGDNNASITFVIQGQDLTGTVRVGREMYRIEPLGDGLQAIIKINSSAFPSEEPSVTGQSKIKSKEQDIELPKKSEKDNGLMLEFNGTQNIATTASVEVLVAYTPSAATVSGNIIGLIQLAIAEANQSYANSNISIRLLLDDIVPVNYVESGSFDTDLNRFMGTSDGYMDTVHSYRTRNGADVCMLIINNDDYCGLAAAIDANASSAFCVVHYDCATGYYSFAHEIGHLQGARHQRRFDGTGSYQHGYLYASGGWRTIMAYNESDVCPDGYCDRLQYWSNPDMSYGGVSIGTQTYENNTRKLNETASTVGGFRTSSNVYVPDDYSTISSAISSVTSGQTVIVNGGSHTLISNVTVNSGITLKINPGTNVVGGGYYIQKNTGATVNIEAPAAYILSNGNKYYGVFPSIQSALSYASSDQTVIVLPGNYTMSSSSTVASGVTLTISAATSLAFSSGVILTVNGTLNAQGTSSQRITFDRSGTSSTWGGITFNSASNGSLNYCDIKNAGIGVGCNGYLPSISNCIISNNGFGLDVEGIGTSSNRITNNTITGNSVVGIYISGSVFICDNNTISNNGFNGILCSNSSSNYLNLNPILYNNKITGHTIGLYCYFSSPWLSNKPIWLVVLVAVIT